MIQEDLKEVGKSLVQIGVWLQEEMETVDKVARYHFPETDVPPVTEYDHKCIATTVRILKKI